MLKLAKQLAEAREEGRNHGLSPEEEAFYDALNRPQAVKDFYKNDELIAMSRELTEALRRNSTIAGKNAHPDQTSFEKIQVPAR